MKPKLKLVGNVHLNRSKTTAVGISKSDNSHHSGRIIKKKPVKKLGKELLNTSKMNVNSNNISNTMKIVSRNVMDNKKKTVRKCDSEILEAPPNKLTEYPCQNVSEVNKKGQEKNVLKISSIKNIYKRKKGKVISKKRRQFLQSRDRLLQIRNKFKKFPASQVEDSVHATLIHRAEQLDEAIQKVLWKKFEDLGKEYKSYSKGEVIKDYKILLLQFLHGAKSLQLENITPLSKEKNASEVDENKEQEIVENKEQEIVENKEQEIVENAEGKVGRKKRLTIVEKVSKKRWGKIKMKTGVIGEIKKQSKRRHGAREKREKKNKKKKKQINKKRPPLLRPGESYKQRRLRIKEESLRRKEREHFWGKTELQVSKANGIQDLPKVKSYEIVM